jgi:hypothetical protein
LFNAIFSAPTLDDYVLFNAIDVPFYKDGYAVIFCQLIQLVEIGMVWSGLVWLDGWNVSILCVHLPDCTNDGIVADWLAFCPPLWEA